MEAPGTWQLLQHTAENGRPGCHAQQLLTGVAVADAVAGPGAVAALEVSGALCDIAGGEAAAGGAVVAVAIGDALAVAALLA